MGWHHELWLDYVPFLPLFPSPSLPILHDPRTSDKQSRLWSKGSIQREKGGTYSRAFLPILKLHRRLVSSGCPFSPPSVPTIPWSPSNLVSLWFNFLLLYECSVVQGNLTPPNAGEAEIYNMAVPPWGSQDSKDVRRQRLCRCWVPNGCYKVDMGPDLRRERPCRLSHWGRFLEEMEPRLSLRGRTFIINVLQSLVLVFFF